MTLSSPRVLYLIDSLLPGGAEKSLVEMAPGLLRGGIDLEVAVLHDGGSLKRELEDHGISVHVVEGTSRGAWILNAARLVGSLEPDLVHTTLFESDLAGRLAAFVKRIPVVSTLASTPYGAEHKTEKTVRRTRLFGAQAADLVTGRLVRRFHAVSRSAEAAGIARLRIDPRKIDVIPRGRDLNRMGERTADRRAAVRERLGVALDVPIALVVARQEPSKGIEVLLRALPAALRQEPQMMVLIAGREGRATPDYGPVITGANLKTAVWFLGERDDVADLLAASDLFVLPSLREGLPGAVLEAMAMGIPIITSDLPAVREAVPGPEYALLVPPGHPESLASALLDVLQNPTRANERSDAARQRFTQCFDIRRISDAMATFYRVALMDS